LKEPIDNRSHDRFPAHAEKSVSPKLGRDPAESGAHRRIGLHHIAFLRGYFEGLDVGILADQYLALGRDKKRGLAAKRWIVEELVAAARKRGDAVGARLLRLPAGALPELDGGTSAESVDLEVFREQVDPDGVYSESELVDLLKASISASKTAPGPQARRAQRNTRLRHRQRALLERLEHALAEPPRAHHPIRDWLDAALATRLASAGFSTLAELADFITLRGYRWYRHIPRVGEQAAIRILQWMERHAADLGITLPEHSRLPRKAWSVALCERVAEQSAAPRGGIAPIEHFSPSCPTAQSDRVLLLQWLLTFRSCPSTHRAYRSQAERLLLWTALERGIGLSAMTAADVSAFFAFVTRADLPPEWCGPKAERQTAAWRPIERSPSTSSISVARRILKLAFDYLCAQAHCAVNPFIRLRDMSIPGELERGVACDSMTRGAASEIEKTAAHTKTLGVCAMDRPSSWHPAERVIAYAREHALIGREASSAGHAPTRSALRHSRLAVVHTLLNATAWPLSILVQLRAEHVLSAVPIREGMASAALCFHDGKRLRRAHLNHADLCLMDEYFRLREGPAIGQLSENPFLIGRHGDEEPKRTPSPITPNVLGRAIRQYHRSHALEVTTHHEESAAEDPLTPQKTGVFTSLRTFKRRARQQLRFRHPGRLSEEHFVKPCLVTDLRRLTSLNPT